MKLIKHLGLLLITLLNPSISHATQVGLWEVIGYPKSITSTALNAKKTLLAVSVQDKASVRHSQKMATPRSALSGTADDYANLADGTIVMHICVVADGTWHEVDFGSENGGWSIVGDQISLSGNNDTAGSSGVLTVLEENISMTGDWQQWAITDPLLQQNIYATLWTLKSASCN